MTNPGQDARRRATALELVVAVTEAAQLAADEEDLARAVNDAILGQGQVDAAAAYRLSADGQRLELLDDEGMPEGRTAQREIPVEHSISGEAIRGGILVHVFDVRHDERVHVSVRDRIIESGMGSIAAVPVSFRKQQLGVLTLLWRDVRVLDAVEKESFVTVGRTVGLAIHNLRRMAELQHALARAARDNEQTRLILETVPLRLFWKDIDCRYTGCNLLFARDTGLSSVNDVIGRTDADMPWKDQAGTLQAIDRDVMRTGQPRIKYELDLPRMDGTVHRERVSKMPVRDDAGEIVGVLGCYEDVTERMTGDLRKS